MRILLADDDSATLDFVRRALSADGHEVAVAEDGSIALEMLIKNGRNFALLIADVDMPGLDGLALCERAAGINSAMPVLLMSAHHTQVPGTTGLSGVRCEFLLKPFTLEEMRAAVRRLSS